MNDWSRLENPYRLLKQFIYVKYEILLSMEKILFWSEREQILYTIFFRTNFYLFWILRKTKLYPNLLFKYHA